MSGYNFCQFNQLENMVSKLKQFVHNDEAKDGGKEGEKTKNHPKSTAAYTRGTGVMFVFAALAGAHSAR